VSVRAGGGTADSPGMVSDARRGRRTGKPGNHPWRNLLFALPALIAVALFFYASIAFIVNASLADWNFIGAPKPVGLGNFQRLLVDPIFGKAVIHSILYGGVVLFAQAAIGLGLAILVSGRVKFGAFYKTLFFIPVIIAPGILAYVFRRLFDPGGEMSQFMHGIGLGQLWQPWLAYPETALWAIIAMGIYSGMGGAFLIYSAALTQIDREILEAAAIDGASGRQSIRYVVMPLLKGTHAIFAIFGLGAAIGVFDIIYLSTEGGPARATETISTYLFKKSIVEFKGGYASAISLVVLVVGLLLTFAILAFLRERPSRKPKEA